jgi:hypothetical protein
VRMSPLRAVGFLREMEGGMNRELDRTARKPLTGSLSLLLPGFPSFLFHLSLPFGRRASDSVSRCHTRRRRSQARGKCVGHWDGVHSRRCAHRVAVGGGTLLHSSLSFPAPPARRGLFAYSPPFITALRNHLTNARLHSRPLKRTRSRGTPARCVTPLLRLSLSPSVSPRSLRLSKTEVVRHPINAQIMRILRCDGSYQSCTGGCRVCMHLNLRNPPRVPVLGTCLARLPAHALIRRN